MAGIMPSLRSSSWSTPRPGESTQPRSALPETSGMNANRVACALWIGSLLVAADPAVDPLPASLDEFVTTYLALIRPAAQA